MGLSRDFFQRLFDFVDHKHFPWIEGLAAQYGIANTKKKAQTIFRQEAATICAKVLAEAGVYKNTPEGLREMITFLEQVGFQA